MNGPCQSCTTHAARRIRARAQVWINRATSGRSAAFPLGNSSLPSVASANRMVSNLVLALVLLTLKGVFWIVEQPAGSLLEEHPRWKELCRMVKVYRTHVWMSDYGAPSPKPSWLYSQMSWISEIRDFRSDDTRGRALEGSAVMSTKRTRADGTVAVTGGADLKASQAYTPAFGQAVVRLHARHQQAMVAAQTAREAAVGRAHVDVAAYMQAAGRDLWCDSSLPACVQFLLGPGA